MSAGCYYLRNWFSRTNFAVAIALALWDLPTIFCRNLVPYRKDTTFLCRLHKDFTCDPETFSASFSSCSTPNEFLSFFSRYHAVAVIFVNFLFFLIRFKHFFGQVHACFDLVWLNWVQLHFRLQSWPFYFSRLERFYHFFYFQFGGDLSQEHEKIKVWVEFSWQLWILLKV